MKKFLKVSLCSLLTLLILAISMVPLAVGAETANGGQIAKYYRTMSFACEDISLGNVGRRAIPNSASAMANVKVVATDTGYDIYVQRNFAETLISAIDTDCKVNIYFGDYTMFTNNTAFDIVHGDVTFNANARGGIVSHSATRARCVQLRSGALTVNGGRYEAFATGGQACCFMSAGKLTVTNVRMQAVFQNGQARCVSTVDNAVTELTKCTMTAIAKNGRSMGFYNLETGSAILKYCTIYAYSNYKTISGQTYANSSVGVDNRGTMTMKQCRVYGTHSGVQTTGPLSVMGGVYEGYGHGGFYLAGSDNHAVVRNATILCSPLPAGYTANIACNNNGMYIGGKGSCNTQVRVVNCYIEGSSYAVALRGTEGETGNILYMSDCRLGGKVRLRIDADHKVYLGPGNSFTASAANHPEKVVVITRPS